MQPSINAEIHRHDFRPGQIAHAVFDFDGTLSLIRQGWQDVMTNMMVRILLETPNHPARAVLQREVRRFIDELTGKQTIYQIQRLVQLVTAYGGRPLSAQAYKQRYLEELSEQVTRRLDLLIRGQLTRDDLIVPGSFSTLRTLHQRGIICHIASGSDQEAVMREAQILGLRPYVEGRIAGARPDFRNFSKAAFVQSIVHRHGLDSSELVGFGDGVVETRNVADVGGIAIGIAGREPDYDQVDPVKRDALVAAGAHITITSFQPSDQLVNYLLTAQ